MTRGGRRCVSNSSYCFNSSFQVNDLSRVAKESDVAANGRVAAEKQAYMSLPRPGVSNSSVSRRKHAGNSSDSSNELLPNGGRHPKKTGLAPTRVVSQTGDEASTDDERVDKQEVEAFQYRISLIIDDLQSDVEGR